MSLPSGGMVIEQRRPSIIRKEGTEYVRWSKSNLLMMILTAGGEQSLKGPAPFQGH